MMWKQGSALRTLALSAVVACAGSAQTTNADVVIDWNTVYLDTVRAVGGPPCPLARAAAMMHVAMYDTLQAIDQQYTPLIVKDEFPLPGTSRNAAISAAAHRVLVNLYPARQAIFDQELADVLEMIPDGDSEDQGVALGVAVADKVIASHAGDQPFANDTNYVYGNVPGAYEPTFPDFTTPPFSPGWGNVKPWCMLRGSQFRPASGPLGYRKMESLIKSGRYAAQLREVMLYGKRTSQVRTADQTELAWFWANDRNGTFKPAGQLNAIAQTVSGDQGLTLSENCRLFAMINVAMGDAGIVAWDGKYLTNIDLWRPISAIRKAHLDGNPLTSANKNWVPLLDFSPPFPGYLSGHASFGGAWAAAMKSFFGTDNITFDATTDEPIVADVVRRFTSFSQAGFEDAESRIYLGVHFRMDVVDSYNASKRMGETMAQYFFLPTCRADLSRDGSITSDDMSIYTDAYFNRSNAADFNRDGDIDTVDTSDFFDAYMAGCNN